MNYIELINRFWKVDLEFSFSGNETRLYMYLLHVSNTMAWKNPIRLSYRQVELGAGLTPNTLRAARIQLKKAGLIEFKTGRAGNSKTVDNKTVYELICSKNERQVACQTERQTDTVNKLETINLNNIPPISPQGGSVAMEKLGERVGMEDEEEPGGMDCRRGMGRGKEPGGGEGLPEAEEAEAKERGRGMESGDGNTGLGKERAGNWKAVDEEKAGDGEGKGAAVGGVGSNGVDFVGGNPEVAAAGGMASGTVPTSPTLPTLPTSPAPPVREAEGVATGGNPAWELEFDADVPAGEGRKEAGGEREKPDLRKATGNGQNGRNGRGKVDKRQRGNRSGQKAMGGGEESPLRLPFESESFRQTWTLLASCPKWRGKTRWALVQVLHQLGRYEEEFAVALMETAVVNDWQGVVFPETAGRYRAWKAARKGGGRPSPGRLNVANHNNDKTYENF